jgi:TPR repeat protein
MPYCNTALSDILSLEPAGGAPEWWNSTAKAIVLFGIACALAHIHGRGLWHGYLKPSRVLIDEDNHGPLLTDYGFGETEHVGREDEVYRPNGEKRGPGLDVYQFGVLACVILTGSTNLDPNDLARFPFMSRVIRHATAKDPSERPNMFQILYAMRHEPQLVPEIDQGTWDTLTEQYFSAFYRGARPGDQALFDTVPDHVPSSSSEIVRRAWDLYRQGNAAQAARLAKTAARLKYGPGLYLYAVALLKWNVVPHAEQEGLSNMEEAAILGHPGAMYEFGVRLMRQGQEEAGLNWLRQAADSHAAGVSDDAHHVIGQYHDRKGECALAMQEYRLAARNDSPAALIDYTRALLDPRFGEVDKDEAFRRLDQAAENDCPNAMFRLGQLYREGKACDRDLHKAAAYFERAAAHNFHEAYCQLAVLYFPNERGVPQVRPEGQDAKTRAIEFYEKAVKAEDTTAVHNYAVILFDGKSGTPPDQGRAIEMWKWAADRNVQKSQIRYAECVEKGLVPDATRRDAINYYLQATCGTDQLAKEKAQAALDRLGASSC